MNQLLKWTFIFATLMILVNPTHAWNVASKSVANGPVIHATYFLTPNNENVKVHAQGYVGSFLNGICRYYAIYDLGDEMVKTGDIIYYDGIRLKSLITTAFNCMTVYYTYQQIVNETFKLQTDGINFVTSFPEKSEMSIL